MDKDKNSELPNYELEPEESSTINYESISTAIVAVLAALVGCILVGLILVSVLLLLSSNPASVGALASSSLLASSSNLLPTVAIYLAGSILCLGIFSYFSPKFTQNRVEENLFDYALEKNNQLPAHTIVIREIPRPQPTKTNNDNLSHKTSPQVKDRPTASPAI